MESYQLVSFFTGEITGFVSVLSIGVHGDNLCDCGFGNKGVHRREDLCDELICEILKPGFPMKPEFSGAG